MPDLSHLFNLHWPTVDLMSPAELQPYLDERARILADAKKRSQAGSGRGSRKRR